MDSQQPSNAEVILRSAVAEALRAPSPAQSSRPGDNGPETTSAPTASPVTGPPPSRPTEPSVASVIHPVQPSRVPSQQPPRQKETHVPVPTVLGQPGHVPNALPSMQLHPPQLQSMHPQSASQMPIIPSMSLHQSTPAVRAPYQPPQPPHPSQQPPPPGHGSSALGYQVYPPGPPQHRPGPLQLHGSAPVQEAPFPSPGWDHARLGPRFQDDYYFAERAMQQTMPESLRRALRANWAKCLLGSDFHEAFVLNAVMRHMSPDSAKKSFRDFGRKLVENAKDELVAHLTTADIDQLSSAILAKASDRFLDAALDRRLRTIEAKPLINALARAERLGYELDDIVEETQSNGQERVIPQHQPREPRAHPPVQASRPAPAPAAPPVVSQVASPLPQGQPKWQCHLCSRLFEFEDPFLHHMTKKICQARPKPNSMFKCVCEFCGKGFSTTLGKQYHEMNKVCGDINAMRAQMQQQQQQQQHMVTSDIRLPQPSLGHFAHAPVSTPVQAPRNFEAHLPSSQPSQPPLSRPLSRHAEHSSPSSTSKIWTADAYAHLTEEQKAALEEEMVKVEEAYAERMREAEAITDPNERRIKLDNLKNSFGTRQSGVRKKYGVRLRERRTRAEMDAERSRMMSSNNDSNRSAASTPQPREQNDAKRPRYGQTERVASRRSASLLDSDDMADRTRKTPASKMSGGAAANGISDASMALQKAATAAALHSSQAYPVELSDSSSDEEDIPARLPAAVRQSLD